MNHVLQIILRWVATHRLYAPRNLSTALPLAVLDLSPAERNEFYNDLEQAFGLDLDDHELSRQRTLGELATYVVSLRRPTVVDKRRSSTLAPLKKHMLV